MSLQSTSISVTMVGSERIAVGSLFAQLPNDNAIASEQATFTDGTGALQAQHLGAASVVLTSGASQIYDLTAFPGLNGNVNYSKIKGIVIVNNGTNASDIVTVGDTGGGSNPWVSMLLGSSARVAIPPESFLAFGTKSAAGFAVAGGNKNLKLLNTGANNVAVTIKLLG